MSRSRRRRRKRRNRRRRRRRARRGGRRRMRRMRRMRRTGPLVPQRCRCTEAVVEPPRALRDLQVADPAQRLGRRGYLVPLDALGRHHEARPWKSTRRSTRRSSRTWRSTRRSMRTWRSRRSMRTWRWVIVVAGVALVVAIAALVQRGVGHDLWVELALRPSWSNVRFLRLDAEGQRVHLFPRRLLDLGHRQRLVHDREPLHEDQSVSLGVRVALPRSH